MKRSTAVLAMFFALFISEVSYSQVSEVEPNLREIAQKLNDCREELGNSIETLEEIAKSDQESLQDFITPYMYIVNVYTVCLYETVLLRLLDDVKETSKAFHYHNHVGILKYAKQRIKWNYDRIKYASPAHYLARTVVDQATKTIGTSEQLIGESIQVLESMKKQPEKSRK
jgi:hypothetical protein